MLSRFRHARRGSVAVEFALVATFLLLPLFGGGADFVEILSAQAQLNTTLQSLYYFAYTNPTLPANSPAGCDGSNSSAPCEVVAAINNYAVHRVNYGGSQLRYVCVGTSGAADTPSPTNPTTCGAGLVLETFVYYSLTTSVSLTVPIPSAGAIKLQFQNPFPLSASGIVQIASKQF